MNQPTTSPRRLHPLIATAAATLIIASLAATAAITGVFPKASGTGEQTAQTQSAQVANQPVVDTAAPAAGAGSQQQAATQPQQAQAGQATTEYAGQPQPPGSLQSPSRPSPSVAEQPAPGAYPQQQQQKQQQQYAQQQYSQPQYGQPQQQQYAQQQQGSPQPSYVQQQTQQPYAPQQRAAAPCASCGTVESISTVRHEGRGTGLGAVGGAVAGGLIGNQFGGGTGRLGMTALGAVGGGFAGNAVEKHLRSTTVYQVRVRMDNGRTRYFTYREAPPFQQGEPVRIERGTLVAR